MQSITHTHRQRQASGRLGVREHDREHQGFVLVMVLVLIALAALLLSRLATRSLRTVDRATMHQHALQQKWAVTSCRLALLSRADELFADQETIAREEGYGWPFPARLTLLVRLGETEYELLLGDEDAKANLNMIDRESPGQVFQAVAQARLSGGTSLAPTLLRPLVARPGESQFRPYRTWGQVLDLQSQERLPLALPESIAAHLTLSGQGRINLARASDDAVRLLLSSRIQPSKIGELADLRRGWTDDLKSLLDSEEIDLSRREKIIVRGLVSQESSAYSLWIVARDAVGSESLRLFVSDPSDRAAQQVQSYSW